MAKRRKTEAERRAELARQDREVWEGFRPQLAALKTMDDAWALWAQQVSEGSPGRRYYSNLGFFLNYFARPAGANGAECVLYAAFIDQLGASGVLKPEDVAKIKAALLGPSI